MCSLAAFVEESAPIGQHALVENFRNRNAARFAAKEDNVARVLEAQEAWADVIAGAA